jgi:hypothetical protein
VRIFGGFTLGVVLAVNRRPLLGDHAGRHPQPEAEEMTRKRMQFQGAVRLVTMKINGDSCDRDVSKHQRDDDIAPPGQVNQTIQHAGFS